MDNGFNVNTDFVENEIILEEPQNDQNKKEIFEWLGIIVAALVSVVVVFTFVIRLATISGDSMLNTLHDGEKIIISDLFYEPKYGDIVVISRNIANTTSGSDASNGPIIKRVIATENQIVDIDSEKGIVYVDGVALKEKYVCTHTRQTGQVTFPVVVPEGCIFVLGDNRAISLDSRYSSIGDNGMIDKRYVLGHAIFRIWPLNRLGDLTEK